MSFRQFYGEIAKGLPSPAYLIHSDDGFLLYDALTHIRDAFGPSDALNTDSFDLASPDTPVSFEGIIDLLNTLPFLTGRRLVIVRNIQKMKKAEVKRLGSYLGNPSPASLLVMLCEGAVPKTLDAAFLKTVKVLALAVPEKEIPSWVRERARKRGITLSDRAIDYLVSCVGTDFGMLASEVEKCSALGKESIDAADLKDTVYAGIEYSAFDLIRALERGDAGMVFRIFEQIGSIIDPMALLGALNWHYGAKGAGDARLSREIFSALHEADIALKSSRPCALEELLVRLIRLKRAPAGRSPAGRPRVPFS